MSLPVAKTPRSSPASWLRAAPISPNPLYYAQRTVDVASARLWLIEGIPIDDVVTLLEVRRRFEIPIALCRARAREIAQTAQRMIARRKIA